MPVGAFGGARAHHVAPRAARATPTRPARSPGTRSRWPPGSPRWTCSSANTAGRSSKTLGAALERMLRAGPREGSRSRCTSCARARSSGCRLHEAGAPRTAVDAHASAKPQRFARCSTPCSRAACTCRPPPTRCASCRSRTPRRTSSTSCEALRRVARADRSADEVRTRVFQLDGARPGAWCRWCRSAGGCSTSEATRSDNAQTRAAAYAAAGRRGAGAAGGAAAARERSPRTAAATSLVSDGQRGALAGGQCDALAAEQDEPPPAVRVGERVLPARARRCASP